MSEPSKALPTAWVERLFLRFQAIYGNRVATMWGDAEPTAIKAVWGDELGDYEASDLKSALDSIRPLHPDYPPTLYQFADLCRDAKRKRANGTPRLDYDPREPIAPEVEQAIESAFESKTKPGTWWAERILERVAAGSEPRPPMYAVQSAKEVLGL